MKRVLIVSPHFPPVNAADMQRVRMLLPFFTENGWQAEVLAVSPEQVAAPLDPWLADGLPEDVAVHRVKAMGLKWSRLPGLGTLGLRALRALARRGDSLLESGQFDLVYFSTTVFEVHILGPRWKRRCDVPFVMDYQDPWVNDYYRNHPHITPPGGRIKYALSDAMHRWMEPRVLRECAGITSVSPEYPRQLAKRYRWFADAPSLVQAFPGAKRDFERLPPPSENRSIIGRNDGIIHWVYIGRGGGDMAVALRGIFLAIHDFAPAELKRRLRLHFIGTSYAAAGSGMQTVVHISAEYGLEFMVEERVDRISYVDALVCMREADALIVPGSDDPAYTASKIYPYLLAHRPMLSVFHEKSTVVNLIAKVGGAVCVAFNEETRQDELALRIGNAWFANNEYNEVLLLDEEKFMTSTDQGCATVLCSFFNSLIGKKSE